MSKETIIFFGRMEWGFSNHLWHHLSREFAIDSNVYYVDPLYMITGELPLDVIKDSKDGKELKIIRYGLSLWDKVPLMHKAKIKNRVRRLNQELQKHNLSSAILFFYNPWDAYDYRELIKKQIVVYYATDNAKELFNEPIKSEFVRREDWLCKRADLIFGLSRILTEDLARKYPNKTYYISEGVNPDVFEFKGKVFPFLKEKKMRACYMGTLDDSLDWDLLEKAAVELPEVEFILVGTLMLHGLKKRFDGYKNVKFLGFQKYELLGSILGAVDVCLLMYKNNEFNRMRNPIKLLEYFAAGKVVVSTDFPIVHEYPELVLVAKNRDDFVKNIRLAITENLSQKCRDKLLKTVRNNTWSKRKEEIKGLIYGLGKG